MVRKNLGLVGVAITLWTVAAWYNISLAQELTKEWIEEFASPLVENQVLDGLSIGYIEGGTNFGIVHLGSANDSGKKANNSTIYEIGSISKVFTGILLADAVARGEIDLEEAVQVTNQAGIKFPSRDGRSITWRDLSTHRSGLPRLATNMAFSNPADPYHDYDANKAAEFLAGYELPRKPGESQEYSNYAVSVLGYLISQKASKSYEQLLKERIAEPLRMTDCTIALSPEQKKRLATPHKEFGSETAPWEFANLPGAGGIRASTRDMMRFARAQLKPPKGKVGEAIELAWKQHSEGDTSGPATGLGWMIAGDGETRWHNGKVGGSQSALFINRPLNSAIIVLSNTAANNEVDQLAINLIRKMAGVEPKATPLKLSPFTAVRFEEDKIFVDYDGQAYRWRELDGIKVEDIIASGKKQFQGLWRKRISEDLVELLIGMGHEPGATVRLRLEDLKTKKDRLVEKAPMTKENRRAVCQARHTEQKASGNLANDKQHRRRLVGRYQLTPNFIFDVQDRDGHMMVGITNQPTQEVFPDSPTMWSYRSVEATLEFNLPEKGPATSLVLHQNGNRQKARRIEDSKTKDLKIDAKHRARLVGRYKLNPDFIFDVKDRDGHLMVGITNQPTQEVFPDSLTHWSYRSVDATLEFKLPKKGRARSLVLHQNGIKQTARRVK